VADGEWSDLSIVIPTLNEAENLPPLLGALFALYPGVKVVVADDGSTDGTPSLVREIADGPLPAGSKVILIDRCRANIKGLTASVLDGLREVRSAYCVVMDGDLQHPPEVVGRMLRELRQGVDLVAAARLPYRENQNWCRIVVTRISKWIAQQRLRLCGLRIKDPLSGLFAFRTELVQDVVAAAPGRFELRGYKVLFDLLRALPRRTKIIEVDYQFGFRTGGRSKLRAMHAFYFLRSIFK